MKNITLTYPNKQLVENILNQNIQYNTELLEDNKSNNQLYYGDNLKLLYYLYNLKKQNKFEGVDLIYIDPPFATGQKFKNKNNEICYEDNLKNERYLEFIRVRLILLRELLKETGSIYVHLDQRTSHYVKIIMEEVFGEDNFVNEIVWSYNGTGKPRKGFKRKHDYILYFSKSKDFYFNDKLARESIPEKTIQTFTRKDEYGQYKVYTFKDKPNRKYYLDINKGIRLRAVWEISIIQSNKERCGYVTQKPEALLERIIKASSNENDLILDCFAGSGTTGVVASKLNRRWIMCDNSELSIKTIKHRFSKLKGDLNLLDSFKYNSYKIR